ncbi:WD40/YVTN/BNR-like repeat-containing protein [Tropicimonas isoalkanivorans]|uniref:BNR/Asp-box repeat-containing protein n=1 Tax=Tropicimonas isoalkanivorans TaxID=441112 RepID=A0A1I1MNC6_9RHOB|nr:hypothetical protein [Tropicimonas isoalkanivorans]SFC86994.1 BNR/Asp-box repeat-containing protein [Tropicimonas isoalkanivorans]
MTIPKTDGLHRRAFLGATAAACIVGTAPPLIAAPSPQVRALVFAGSTVLAAGNGLMRSQNGGATWRAAAGPDQELRALTTHPQRPDRVVAALDAHGLAVSDDAGASWRKAGAGLPAVAIDALATAATTPDTLYAAIAGDGLWRSEDAGETWAFVMDRPFLAEAERDVTALASVDLASGMGGIWLYAGTTFGMQRVPDCFCRWQDVQPGNALDALVPGGDAPETQPLPEGQPVRALVSPAAAPARLYAALPSGIWSTDDAGMVWRKTSDVEVLAIAVDPATPLSLVAATQGALTYSRDGGETWTAGAVI